MEINEISVLLPGPIKRVLQYVANRIVEVVNEDLYDDAVAYLIDILREIRERRSNHIMGMKFLCDTKEHITDYENTRVYKIVKNHINN